MLLLLVVLLSMLLYAECGHVENNTLKDNNNNKNKEFHLNCISMVVRVLCCFCGQFNFRDVAWEGLLLISKKMLCDFVNRKEISNRWRHFGVLKGSRVRKMLKELFVKLFVVHYTQKLTTEVCIICLKNVTHRNKRFQAYVSW